MLIAMHPKIALGLDLASNSAAQDGLKQVLILDQAFAQFDVSKRYARRVLGVGHQLCRDGFGLFACLIDHFERFIDAILIAEARQVQLGQPGDHGQDIVEVMSDAASQNIDGFEFLRLKRSGLAFPGLGDVGYDNDLEGSRDQNACHDEDILRTQVQLAIVGNPVGVGGWSVRTACAQAGHRKLDTRIFEMGGDHFGQFSDVSRACSENFAHEPLFLGGSFLVSRLDIVEDSLLFGFLQGDFVEGAIRAVRFRMLPWPRPALLVVLACDAGSPAAWY